MKLVKNVDEHKGTKIKLLLQLVPKWNKLEMLYVSIRLSITIRIPLLPVTVI